MTAALDPTALDLTAHDSTALGPTAFDPTAFDAAIIDLDGTLVDTIGDFVVALNAALAEHDLAPIDRSFVNRTVGKGSEHLVRQTLRETGADADLFGAVMAGYQHHYLAVNGRHATVYPGVIEGLQRLRALGLKLACLTNKPIAFALPLLQQKGLDGFFTEVFGGDAFAQKKPHPLPLQKTCEVLGTLPARTLMIGDSSNDAEAARAAGCPVVLVGYGYNHGEPVTEVDADGVIDRLDLLFK